jgi:hypothetical protein
MWIGQLRRTTKQQAQALGCLTALIGVLVLFSDLFQSGRIWAEEGRLFLSALIRHGQNASQPWLYLHSGHWDLWTTMIAALAYHNPASAPLIFSWGSIPPYLITAWSMLEFQQSFRKQAQPTWSLAVVEGLLSILILTFAGGPEILFNTTNTQWILCVYVSMRMSTYCLSDQKSAPKMGHIALDALAVVSSFASAVLVPIQLVMLLLIRQLHQIQRWNDLSKWTGLICGFAIQALTTVLNPAATGSNREPEPLMALQGFMVQGLSGLLLPETQLRHILAWPSAAQVWLGVSAIAAVTCLVIELMIRCHQSRGNQLHAITIRSMVYSIMIAAFVYCQGSIGAKSSLLIPGVGLRYFAPERIVLAWLFFTIASRLSGYVNEPQERLSKLLGWVLCLMIVVSGSGYFNKAQLSYLGIKNSACSMAMKKSFNAIGNQWPRGKELAICPEGWSIDP